MREAAKVTCVVFVLQILVLFGTEFVFATHGGSLSHEISGQDAREFMLLADQLLTDLTYHLPGEMVPESWRPPGYPLFVALVFALTNHSIEALLVVLALVGAATSGLLYIIGNELGLGRVRASLAAIFFGLSPAVIWIPPSGMGGDITFVFLLTCALYLFLKLNREGVWPALLLGAVLGLATLIRPIGLYLSLVFIVALPFFFSRRELRYALGILALVLVSFALVLTPWMVRNYLVADRFALTSQFTFNPFYYNMAGFYAWEHGTSLEIEQKKLMQELGASEVYDVINGFTYHEKLQGLEKQFLKENLMPYTAFHVYKSIPFFAGSGVNVVYATITNEVPTFNLPFFPRAEQNTASLFYGGDWFSVMKNLLYYWPSTLERLAWLSLFLLSFAAPFVTEGRARQFTIFAAIMILAVAALSSPIAQPRYRIPAEPFIWLSAILALSSLYRFWRPKLSSQSRNEPT